MKKKVVVVGVYKGKKVVGKELLYEPTGDERKNGEIEFSKNLN